MAAKWQEPAFRAKMDERDNRRRELQKADPLRFSRLGVPNGLRKAEAQRMWAIAETQADKAIQALKAAGVLPSSVSCASTATAAETATETANSSQQCATIAVPETEAGMAEAALREAFRLALGPTGSRAKAQALATILRYTRLKPMGVLQLAMGDAESVLDELANS
jgi:hypothetical protein